MPRRGQNRDTVPMDKVDDNDVKAYLERPRQAVVPTNARYKAIMGLLGSGLSKKEVARRLGVSENTVRRAEIQVTGRPTRPRRH